VLVAVVEVMILGSNLPQLMAFARSKLILTLQKMALASKVAAQ